MFTVQVPTFDQFDRYKFTGYVDVKIKNTPNWQDVNAITRHLPGIPQGGVGREPLQDLIKNGTKPVREFYDARQNTRMLKGYNVIVKKD